jgi:dihydrofolate reductase/thymidylate synthase
MGKISIIYATDSKNGFSKGNKIPWDLGRYSNDLRNFARITKTNNYNNNKKNILLFGYNTWVDLPFKDKKFPFRISCVLTSKDYENSEDLYFFKSINEFIRFLIERRDIYNDVYIIGGKSIIESFIKMSIIDEIYQSIIPEDLECDNKLEITEYIERYKKEYEYIDNQNIRYIKYIKRDNYEDKYIKMLWEILMTGDYRQTRNARTYSLFSKEIEFNMREYFPILTTRKMFMKGIFEELIFFIKGQTDSKILENKNVNIWKPNTTKEFIEKCGLNYEEGDMGPMYGFQWRHFNAEYKGKNHDYKNQGIDQLEEVLELLIRDKHSRRILMTDYNPEQAKQGVLYPCHSIIIQLYVKEEDNKNYVSINMYQRSVDTTCGLGFNITSTGLLLHLICNTLNARVNNNIYYPDKMKIIMGDVHIYESHIDNIILQIQRETYKPPTINIKNKYVNMEEYKWEDIEIKDYVSHPVLKYDMVA